VAVRHNWRAEWQGAKTYIVVGFQTEHGVVIGEHGSYAPLARWMIGKPLPYVLRQIKPYGGTIKAL
jgi:hypothetical protein